MKIYGGNTAQVIIGDVLRFNSGELIGDTIYRSNKPIAVITHCGKGIFRNSDILKIKSIGTSEKGTYHAKGSN